MSKYKIKPISPEGLKTYPLGSRKSKVRVKDFALPCSSNKTLSEFIQSLPNILAGKDFKEFVTLMKRVKAANKPIIWALGAHVIKVGLNPVFIDLMEKGWVTGVALNGAGIIHDFEIAFAGRTSEDIDVQIRTGDFGMAQETGALLNQAIISSSREGVGLGEGVGKMMAAAPFSHKGFSLVARAYDLDIPVTVHVAVGTDIIHFHPQASGEALGKTSLRDFFLFCSLIERLEGGGVFINVGSAVVLPEVFLKAVSLIRSRGAKLEKFSTAVFDFIHHYRPDQNVVKRPLGEQGRGFYFIGHHEIMIPLFAAALQA